jgi:O-acetyl-ADP-ribose deacetylase (regulator of RNase III)
MIVNCTSPKFDLSNGFASKSLLTAAGDKMQQDCSKESSDKKAGEVVVTKGYRLPCRWVCHGFCFKWVKDGQASKAVWM